MSEAAEDLRDGGDPEFPFAMGVLLPLLHDNHQMFDRVPLLLPTVPLSLSSFRTICRLFGAVEEGSSNLILAHLDPPFGNLEDAGEERFERLEESADTALVDLEQESEECVRDVGAVVEEEQKEAILEFQAELPTAADLALAAFACQTIGIRSLVPRLELCHNLISPR